MTWMDEVALGLVCAAAALFWIGWRLWQQKAPATA